MVSAARTSASNCDAESTPSYVRKAWLNSRKYFRRLLESLARISRSTPTSACSCAALRRDRRLEVVAIKSSRSLTSYLPAPYAQSSPGAAHCPTFRHRLLRSPRLAPADRYFSNTFFPSSNVTRG